MVRKARKIQNNDARCEKDQRSRIQQNWQCRQVSLLIAMATLRKTTVWLVISENIWLSELFHVKQLQNSSRKYNNGAVKKLCQTKLNIFCSYFIPLQLRQKLGAEMVHIVHLLCFPADILSKHAQTDQFHSS